MANRLMIFAGILFMLFGVLLGLSESPEAENLWGGLCVLNLGIFALSMATDAISRGQIRFQFSTIIRRESPRLFWSAVLLVGAAGCVVLACGIWVLAFRTV